jgi:DNA-directed RNA polymerase subunit RPC12/RpoP
MKTCSECGQRIYREPPENDEYGVAVVGGRRYPESCPNCGARVV